MLKPDYMALRFTLQQNKIKSNKAYGKWYAHTVKTGELTMDDIERRIQGRCTVTRADVRAVLAALNDVVEDGLKSGRVVNLNELGKFYLSIRSESVATPEEFSVKRHVKDVVCKYTPAGHRVNQRDRRIERSFTSNVKLEQMSLYDNTGHVAKRIRRGGEFKKG
jgi:predicted histone-like DNA-binding protein